jgi:hypothetical protein
MEIKKIGEDGGVLFEISSKKATAPRPNELDSQIVRAETRSNDAVKIGVSSDFDSEQRARVARIASEVRSNVYRQPDGRTLSRAFDAGIADVVDLLGRTGE